MKMKMKQNHKSITTLLVTLIIFLSFTRNQVFADDEVTSVQGLNGCVVEIGSYIYNLEALLIDSDEYDEDYYVSYNNGNGDVSIDFNICDYSFRECSDEVLDFANEVNENETCSHLSSDDLSQPTITFIQEDDPSSGINIEYTGGNLCNDTSYYSLTLQLNCDEYSEKATYSLDSSTILYPCSPKVIFQTPDACPTTSLSVLSQVISLPDWIACLPVMLVGLFLFAEGGKQYHVTLFLVPTIIACYFFCSLFFVVIFPDSTPDYLVWVWFVIAVIMGIGFGVAMASSPRTGILFLGTSIGILIGLLLYYIFLIMSSTESSSSVSGSTTGLWITLSTCVFIAAVGSLVYFDYAMVISSAIYGSYIFVRGLSILFGGWPSEYVMYQEFKNNSLSTESASFFVYLTLMVILIIVSMLIQFQKRSENMEEYSYRQYNFKYRRADLKNI